MNYLAPVFVLFAIGYYSTGVPALCRAADDARSAASTSVNSSAVPQSNQLFQLAHEDLLKKAKSGVIDVYFLGDSITRRWHALDYPHHMANWEKNFFGWNAANFGWGGDTTANVLWRIQNGELDEVNPKVVVLMAGTNDLSDKRAGQELSAAADEVVQGIQSILDTIGQKAPTARIVLMGITPRNDDGTTRLLRTIDQINARLQQIADGGRVCYLSINHRLADDRGRLREGVTNDGLHLSNEGYQIWADALKPILTEWLGPPTKTDKAPPATGIPKS